MGREAEESRPGTCRRSWRLSARREGEAGRRHLGHTASKGAAGFSQGEAALKSQEIQRKIRQPKEGKGLIQRLGL